MDEKKLRAYTLHDLQEELDRAPVDRPNTAAEEWDQADVPTEKVDMPLTPLEDYATSSTMKKFFMWMLRRR